MTARHRPTSHRCEQGTLGRAVDWAYWGLLYLPEHAFTAVVRLAYRLGVL